jgi:hypothetical protein
MITVEMLLEEQKSLEAELAEFEPKRRRLALLTEMIKTYPGGNAGQPELIDVSRGMQRFSANGTTEAIMAFLKAHPESFFSPREIAEALIADGFKTKSPNFATTIYTTCKRKGKAQRLELGKKDGTFAFRFKP